MSSQNEPLGINLWSRSSKLRGSKTKQELIAEISKETSCKVLDIYALSAKDLTNILDAAKSGKTLEINEPVTGKRKAPYLSLLCPLFPQIKSLEKLSVSSLSNLVEAFRK